MTTTRWRGLADRLEEALDPVGDLDDLAKTVYAALAEHVSFDFACLATTDPASGVVTWASKTRSLGIGDEEFAASEYGGPDVNKLEEIARRRPPVGVLSLDTDGHPETCRRHREFMLPRFGFTDELRAAFVSRAAAWGALGVYRGPGDPPFTAADAAAVAAACPVVAEAIQRSLFRLPEGRPPGEASQPGPAVLIVDAADRLTQATPGARAAVEELGGFDHGSLPANLQAVIATTRTTREHTESRARTGEGRWLSLRAAPLDGGAGAAAAPDVVVTIEPTSRATLSRLALAAHGLTAREEEVALLVLQGLNTQSIATSLHLSPHTVQDHLKTVFTKLGVSSRREMTARLVLG